MLNRPQELWDGDVSKTREEKNFSLAEAVLDCCYFPFVISISCWTSSDRVWILEVSRNRAEEISTDVCAEEFALRR